MPEAKKITPAEFNEIFGCVDMRRDERLREIFDRTLEQARELYEMALLEAEIPAESEAGLREAGIITDRESGEITPEERIRLRGLCPAIEQFINGIDRKKEDSYAAQLANLLENARKEVQAALNRWVEILGIGSTYFGHLKLRRGVGFEGAALKHSDSDGIVRLVTDGTGKRFRFCECETYISNPRDVPVTQKNRTATVVYEIVKIVGNGKTPKIHLRFLREIQD